MGFIGSGQGPFVTLEENGLWPEPLGPNTTNFLIVGGLYSVTNTTNFPNSCPRFTLLTELNLTVPKARPEAHTFDFIGIRTLCLTRPLILVRG